MACLAQLNIYLTISNMRFDDNKRFCIQWLTVYSLVAKSDHGDHSSY